MRRCFQLFWLFLANGYLFFLKDSKIYQGPIKGICVPFLNCYSCPAAVASCPIGALQHLLSRIRPSLKVGIYQFGLFVIGGIGLIGILVGRMVCGWACPFGLLQEMLYKIPSPKFHLPPFLRFTKYAVLIFFVFLLPILIVDKMGYGQSWFCRYLCPVGTLEAGIPALFLFPGLRKQIGLLFFNKVFILSVLLIMMVLFKRPFCRLLCPLGAFYGLFNHVSLVQMEVDKNRCTKCNLCYEKCPMGIKIYEGPNQVDCIRCLICRDVCPFQAISLRMSLGNNHKGRRLGTSRN